MRIRQLSYEAVVSAEEDPLIICRTCNAVSVNGHYRGTMTPGTLHWSRTGMSRAGLHAFLRARFDPLNAKHAPGLYLASMLADDLAQSEYGIRIPASASRWERRRVLALAKRDGIKLRTQYPHIYAWAHYGEKK